MEQGSEFLRQKNLLNYWRAAIKNESIIGVKIEQTQYREYLVPKNLLNAVGFDENLAARLFEKYKRFLVKHKPFSAQYPIDEEQAPSEEEIVLPVRISPLIYGRKHEHGKYQHSQKLHYIHPIWIAAYLRKNGELFADYPCLLPPWISREYLHPTYQQQELITIGDLSAYDTFLDKNSINILCSSENEDTHKDNLTKDNINSKSNKEERHYISWKELCDYAEKMQEAVAPDLLENLAKNGYFTGGVGKILVVPTEDNNQHYSTKLLKLLDSLSVEEKAFSPLLTRYLTLEKSPDQPLKTAEEQLEYAAVQHLGQMNGAFALAKSQRVALHHLFLSGEEGQILAINGPPGTGKTTLLASIIASFWVQAAIKKQPPPIMVVSSTNNRAITNVIDSFESKIELGVSSTPEGRLAARWVQGVTSFGLYFTGKPRGPYQYYRDITTGTLQELEEYKEQKNYFLENFNQYFNLNISCVEKAANILHEKMLELESSLRSVLEIAVKYKKSLKQYPKRTEEPALIEKIARLSVRLETLKTESRKLDQFKIAWHLFIAKQTWYKPIIFLFPFLKNLIESHITCKIDAFLFDQNIYIESNQTAIKTYIHNQERFYQSQMKRLKALIKSYESHLHNLKSINDAWKKWANYHKRPDLNLETIFDFDSVENRSEQNLLIFLDTELRHKLFQYTMHYWEANWILEIFQDYLNKNKRLDKIHQLSVFRRLAMLAPCFITTMQSGPGFFTFKITRDQEAEFMKGKIDLLIVDEASQVHPGYGAGMIALAKKACVVGDNLQLSPISSLPGAVDIGNMKHYKLIQQGDEYHKISQYGANVASCTQYGPGSVMKLAQYASFFQDSCINQPPGQRGLFLTEHRRCVPEIISYCNEFFYQRSMTYNRPSNLNHPFPAMGYAHISGLARPSGKSKINKTEAMSIAKWIAHKQEVFLNLYSGKNLDQILGIITPFARQADVIRSALKDEGITLKFNNVGTIHTFQGGEFPVIIFSPTYSYDSTQNNYFFDKERNMLNVAVSRAKDHFFVFGDMEIFERKKATPSSFLAEYLFLPSNELLDVKTVREFYKQNPKIVRHINSLEEHREILRKAFRAAEKCILLVSPWITRKALLADNIELLIRSATSRNVEVIIYTDKENYLKNTNRNESEENISILEQAGATVNVVHNIHSKTLAVDNWLFVEGSFNWLSAVRDIPKYEKYEASICCEGRNLKHLIDNFMKRLKDRILYDPKPEKPLRETQPVT